MIYAAVLALIALGVLAYAWTKGRKVAAPPAAPAEALPAPAEAPELKPDPASAAAGAQEIPIGEPVIAPAPVPAPALPIPPAPVTPAEPPTEPVVEPVVPPVMEPVPTVAPISAPPGAFTVTIVGVPADATSIYFRYWARGNIIGGVGLPPAGLGTWFPQPVPLQEGSTFTFNLAVILDLLRKNGVEQGILSGTIWPSGPAGLRHVNSNPFRPENRGYRWNITTMRVG